MCLTLMPCTQLPLDKDRNTHTYTHVHTHIHTYTHIHTMLCKRNNSKRNENSKFKTAMESLLTNQFILVLLFISIKLGIHVVRFSGASSVESGFPRMLYWRSPYFNTSPSTTNWPLPETEQQQGPLPPACAAAAADL